MFAIVCLGCSIIRCARVSRVPLPSYTRATGDEGLGPSNASNRPDSTARKVTHNIECKPQNVGIDLDLWSLPGHPPPREAGSGTVQSMWGSIAFRRAGLGCIRCSHNRSSPTPGPVYPGVHPLRICHVPWGLRANAPGAHHRNIAPAGSATPRLVRAFPS